MGRYIRQFRISDTSRIPYAHINQFLIAEGYEPVVFEGENVYKKGKGILTGPSFFKIHMVAPDVLNLEVWMKYAILPGVYVGEIDLDSFLGWAVKGPLKRRAGYLEGIFLNIGTPLFGAMPYQQGYNPQPQPGYNPQSQQNFGGNQQFNNTATPQNNAGGFNQSAPARFCTGCGAKLAPGSVFCTNCGTRVN